MEKYIEAATAQFEKLLKEQLARAEKMASAEPPKDFASLDKITVGLCGGDGIGPIIMKEARRLLTELLKDEIGSGKKNGNVMNAIHDAFEVTYNL